MRHEHLLAEPRGPLRNRSSNAVFLGYHSVSPVGPPFLHVSPRQFERQLARLAQLGYQSGDRRALELAAQGRLRGRHVFITFDDGYLDNYTEAFPLLGEYGLSAWIFVLPDHLADGGALRWPEVEDACAEHPDVMRSITWEMAAEMADAGFEIGSHTVSHPHLTELCDEALRQELLDSRRALIDRLGRCDSIAYPFGHWDRRVAAAAAAAGYSIAFTLPLGAQRGASRMSIPRVPVDHRDEGRRFDAKLTPLGRRLLLSPAKDRLRRLRSMAPGRRRSAGG